jgi:hypothetical protein
MDFRLCTSVMLVCVTTPSDRPATPSCLALGGVIKGVALRLEYSNICIH